MESNILSTFETQRELNNSLEREKYAKCISCTVEETADAGPSEKAEHRQNNQRQAYSRRRENKSNKQTKLHRKTQNNANNHASNATRLENYDTNAVIPYNIG
ncbi:7748_t:CDS:2, partial [Gigaspora margarita]